MSIWGLLQVIFGQDWLAGAFLSVIGSAIACAGLTIQKSVQYKLLNDEIGAIDGHIAVLKKPSWLTIVRIPQWWIGVLVFMAHSPVNLYAMEYAPPKTFTPLSATVVVFNFIAAYSILNEKFTRRDIVATLVCIGATFAMSISTPRGQTEHMDDFPIERVLEMYDDMSSNVGFAAYLMAWCAIALICLYILSSVSENMTHVAKPMVYPLLVGLFQSQFHFVSKMAHSLIMKAPSHHELLNDTRFLVCITATGVLYTLSIIFTVKGCRNLAMRFFVPAMYVSVTIGVVVESLLFFREWQGMSNTDITIFAVSGFICVYGLTGIRPTFKVITSPDLLSPRQQAGVLLSPLLGKPSEVVKHHEAVLAIMEEYKTRKPEADRPRPLTVFPLDDFKGTWRFIPIFICLFVVGTPLGLFFSGYVFTSFVFLTLFQAYTGWRMCAHPTLFSYVGIKKIAHYHGADFKALHEAEEYERKTNSKAETVYKSPPFKWEDVYHFVVLPNYKEDLEVLKLACQSVANSEIAKTNIVLVLAMEEREKESQEKAKILTDRFKGKFFHIHSTFHPPNIEGETAGKSSNTRWGAKRVFDEVVPKFKLNVDRCVFTVADADSEFHSKYFSALTYKFLYAGGPEDTTPQRYMTIWQPPILHYKNFITQPALVRLASLVTSQHELANLADPNATRVPYSTYSISAKLAQDVDGWDPDWISEDWHMCLKCFFATQGGIQIIPIFYPVCNYAPEGDSYWQTIEARWTQAKRHALGFSELVYFADYYSRVKRSIPKPWDRAVFVWRAFFLFFKMTMIHVVVAALAILSPFNGFLLAYLVQHDVIKALNVNSWTFLLNCLFQIMGLISIATAYAVSVILYESQRHRVDGSDDPKLSIWWRSPALHTISIIGQSFTLLPIFFCFAGAAEWIAAIKTAKTHKFKYDVALKPTIKATDEPGNP